MAGSEGLVCGLFLSRTAPAYRALPRVLGVYSGAVRSRVEFDEAVAADPSNPDAQSFSFDLDFATADFWPQHATTLERDSVLVDARVQRNEMAFVNDARGCVSRACPLAPGVCAEMHPSDVERISVRFIDVAVGGLPYVVMFLTSCSATTALSTGPISVARTPRGAPCSSCCRRGRTSRTLQPSFRWMC